MNRRIIVVFYFKRTRLAEGVNSRFVNRGQNFWQNIRSRLFYLFLIYTLEMFRATMTKRRLNICLIEPLLHYRIFSLIHALSF